MKTVINDETPPESLTLEAKGTVGEGDLEVQAAAVVEIEVQGAVYGSQNTDTLLLAVTVVASLVGGIAGGHVVPGGVGVEFPEDAVEDEALVEEGTAASGGGRGGRDQEFNDGLFRDKTMKRKPAIHNSVFIFCISSIMHQVAQR